jgi:hypothetical protein
MKRGVLLGHFSGSQVLLQRMGNLEGVYPNRLVDTLPNQKSIPTLVVCTPCGKGVYTCRGGTQMRRNEYAHYAASAIYMIRLLEF